MIGKMFIDILRSQARSIAIMETLAGSVLGSPVKFRAPGPGGWAIEYREEIYHDAEIERLIGRPGGD